MKRVQRLGRRELFVRAGALVAAGLILPLARRARADGGEPVTIPVLVPGGIGPDEHWVDVNLGEQVAVAMTGTDGVRAILLASGQPGWETPTGEFRILYRVEDEHMTSDTIGIPRDSPDGYDLDHILWTQYFDNDGDALHTNYWRPESVFGRDATSHGCVGMLEPEARFLWDFLDRGSLVNIHE